MKFVDEATQSLSGWLGRVVPGVAVAIGASRETEPRDGITLRLLQVAPVNRPRAAWSPIELSLRYAVSVRLADTLAAQRAVGEIIFAAVAGTDYQVDAAGHDGCGVILVAKLARLRDVKPLPVVRRIRTDVQPIQDTRLAVDAAPGLALTIQLPAEA